MTIAQRVRELDVNAAQRARANAVFKAARMLIRYKSWYEVQSTDEYRRSTEEVQQYVKTAVAAMSTTSASALAALQSYGNALGTVFAGSGSIFDQVIAAGAFRAQLDERLTIITGGATVATTVGEAMVKPLGSLTLSSGDMAMVKSVGMVTITNETAKFSNPAAVATFNNELMGAVIHEVDAEFLRNLLAGVTPTVSAGTSFANFLTDLGVLQAAVDVGATSQMLLVTSTTKALAIGKLLTTAGTWAFPDVGNTGGPLINGIQVLVSDVAATANAMLMLVPDGIIIADDPIELRASTQATINFSTTPDSPVTASTAPVSFFQAGLLGLLAERRHASKARARSVAAVSF
jgi:hypothetical protein